MAQRKEYFYLDGVRSDAVGIWLQGPVTFSAPAPKMETVEVPGRNGALHFYENAYGNVDGTARCFILRQDDVATALAAVSMWAMAKPGYRRLEVSNEPNVFRLAAVAEGPETEIRMRTLAPFELSFDCKPQRFLRIGERTIHISASGAKLHNPGMPSKPLITLYGTGSGFVTVGGVTVTLKDSFTGLTLDCDTMDAYFGVSNKNGDISAPEFPEIPGGESEVTFSENVTGVDIVPRWWTL